VAFDEQTFRTKATESGYTDDQIESYLKQKSGVSSTEVVADPNTQTTNVSTDTEAAFRAKAEERGFTKEQQDAFLARKAAPPTYDPATFAKPSLDVPFALKPAFRTNSSGDVPIVPLGLRRGGTPLTPDKVREDRIRNVLPTKTVTRIASDIGADPTTVGGINVIYNHAEREQNWRKDKKDLVANLQELTNVDRPFKWMQSKFSASANAEWTSIKRQNIRSIIDLAKERDLDLVYKEGKFFAYDDKGNLHRVTPGTLETLGKAKYETLGGIGGFMAGLKAPITHPLGKLAAAAAGGIAGSVLGEEMDYLSSAIQLHEELDFNVALEKAIGSAQTATLFEIAGLGVGSAAKKLVGVGVERIRRIYGFVADGNTQGAFAALKTVLGNISDDEAAELVARWEALSKTEAPGKNLAEKALTVLPGTRAGGEAILKAAAKQEPRVAASIQQDVNERAQAVLQLTRTNSPEAAQNIQKALNDYEVAVKTNYDVVKNSAKEHVPERYRFGFMDKSVIPMLRDSINKISDPAVVERLARTLENIHVRSNNRTFNDLLDLRELLNEFRYASRTTSKSTFIANKSIDAAKRKIDEEIQKVMSRTDSGKQWLQQWKQANQDYGQYKRVQKNALFKAITKPGLIPENIANSLIKLAPSLDDTYIEVIQKLPKKVRDDVEGEIINKITNRFTLGKGDSKAVAFPELSDELSRYTFSSVKGKQIQKSIEKLAEVYRNDRSLARLSVPVVDDTQNSIAQSVAGKAKAAFVNSLWPKLVRAKGGPKADMSSLITKTAKFLENPLDGKAAKRVLDDIGDDVELTSAMQELQRQAAQEAAEGTAPAQVRVFKDASGKRYLQEGPGRTLLNREEFIPVHRVAKGETVSELLGREVVDEKSLTKAERIILARGGFLALALDNGRLIELR
jgi:hypothetical protein